MRILIKYGNIVFVSTNPLQGAILGQVLERILDNSAKVCASVIFVSKDCVRLSVVTLFSDIIPKRYLNLIFAVGIELDKTL
jgi:hypothetical protein